MAPEETVTLPCPVNTSALHPQDSHGKGRPSHTPVLHQPTAPAPLPSSSSHDDVFPSSVYLTERSSKNQRKVENFENFPPRHPLKLAPIELPLEVKEAQRQKMQSIWKDPENLELTVNKTSSHGKTLLLPVNQITVGQSLVKKEKAHHWLTANLANPSSAVFFQTHQNQTSSQSARPTVNIGQSDVHNAGHSKLHRARQLVEDQSKSGSSTEGLKDDEGKPAASGAKLRQRGMEKVLEKSSSQNPVRKVSEAAVGRGSRRMAVYNIQEAAL